MVQGLRACSTLTVSLGPFKDALGALFPSPHSHLQCEASGLQRLPGAEGKGLEEGEGTPFPVGCLGFGPGSREREEGQSMCGKQKAGAQTKVPGAWPGRWDACRDGGLGVPAAG